MARKIFVSYKYKDARNYVDALENIYLQDQICKFEKGDEDLSHLTDETIGEKLKERMHDSSVTIVLISKNMKEYGKPERDQWIPWEISYSLKEITRGGRPSATNAMLAVILPDENGSYGYIESQCCGNRPILRLELLFEIIGKNMFNKKNIYSYPCPNNPSVEHKNGNDISYINPVRWSDFVEDINGHIDYVVSIQERKKEYNITREIPT